MTTNIENEKPIDPEDPEYKAFLEDLQGNILKGHGRDHVSLRLIEFTGDKQKARDWLRAFGGGGWVTSASRQSEQILSYRAAKKEALFANLLLTRLGYQYCLKDKQIPADLTFREGMLGSRAILNDPPVTEWEPQYDPAKHTIHAMLLLAVTTPSEFQDKIEGIDESLRKIDAKVTKQEGRAYREETRNEEKKRYVEHFGFADGRSQPLFLKEDLDEEDAGDGTSYYDPFAPLSLAVVKDPNGDGYGSYLVFRKLEQNVQGFNERQQSLADEIMLEAAEEGKHIGAMVVGRFENGTPLALSDRSDLGSAPNNFHYDDDRAGLKCPLFAHIRKMNPRVNTKEARSHRVVRRGIPYEDIRRASPPSNRRQSVKQMPTRGVGLLFMCFQSSIKRQFEYLQRLANDYDPDQPNRKTGIDPVIGQGSEGENWPKEWGKAPTTKAPFGKFVTLKGGEYFFAPCLSFFKGL